MRATVLTDAGLAKHAGRFVWLSIDTENDKNAAFLERYPWEAVPTFEVIDAQSEKIAYRWLGAVDAAELVRRFDEAERACGSTGPGDIASPQGEDVALQALSTAGRFEECAHRALSALPGLPPSAVKAAVASIGLDCALSAPEAAPWRADALAGLESATREALGYGGLLDDDRSALYGSLVDARDRQHDDAGGKAEATAWLDWLDRQAREAGSVEARAALDGHRVAAAQRAGAPGRVVAVIERSERELPKDYNPPARLAVVLRELGRYDDALAASDRALRKVYGPRKLNLLDARATIFEKKGDPARAKAALDEALAYASTLPAAQRPKSMIAKIEKRLGQLGTAE